MREITLRNNSPNRRNLLNILDEEEEELRWKMCNECNVRNAPGGLPVERAVLAQSHSNALRK